MDSKKQINYFYQTFVQNLNHTNEAQILMLKKLNNHSESLNLILEKSSTIEVTNNRGLGKQTPVNLPPVILSVNDTKPSISQKISTVRRTSQLISPQPKPKKVRVPKSTLLKDEQRRKRQNELQRKRRENEREKLKNSNKDCTLYQYGLEQMKKASSGDSDAAKMIDEMKTCFNT
ncbi:hypothetical protein CHUAL_010687 [Chamberlinius hualienensis]